MEKKAVLILHDIRSSENIGAIFRTADALGISKIFLTGYTPAPLDKFQRKNPKIAKSALGAEENLSWESEADINKALRKLKKEKFQIIAVEQAENSQDYKKIKPLFPVAFVLGNEVEGIGEDLLKKCDVVAEIPMRGKKESLNVSVAAGVALFRILNL